MTNDSEHIFMCLLIICVSSYVEFLFKYFAFILLCDILLLSCRCFILIFQTEVLLSGKGSMKNSHEYFLLGCACFFLFLLISFEEQVLLLIDYNLLNFSFMVSAFGVLRNLCLTQGQGESSYEAL